MSQQESQTAILVAAEALLRACGYPACRGLPSVVVSTTLLGQLDSAIASWLNADPDAPHGHQDAICGAVEVVIESDSLALLRATCDALREQLAELRGDRPGFCQGAEDCWRQPDLPGGLCHHHSAIAQKPHPWQRAQLRAGVFAVPEEQDG